MTPDDLTFASAGVAGVHYARCWPCMLGQHHTPNLWHTWADDEDIAHAAATGQPDPSDRRCGCPCADVNAPPYDDDGTTPPYDDEPDVDVVSLDADPCPVCGAAMACAWDSEGRPLIHVDTDPDGEPT